MKYHFHRLLLPASGLIVIFATQTMPVASGVAVTVQKNKISCRNANQGNAITQTLASKGNIKVARTDNTPNFLVLAGGGAPDHNEIALEKNVLYFQRTLKELGYNPFDASVYFANGNDGKATIRYIDETGNQRFKVPAIPNLKGSSTFANLQSWMWQTTNKNPEKPVFFYFTGHGIANQRDMNNSSMTLWNRKLLSVKEFSGMLDKLPQKTPVAVVMAQCYSGSFANFIYQGGDPKRPIALQSRCGFFATIKTLPSVGCTPMVNESDYKDYSSSFFAGLSGKNRIGKPVNSADYNQDNKISYAEAHAFAKVDEQTIDLPISTSESWLQEKASKKESETILAQPISKIIQTARPEQKYVVTSIAKMFSWDINKSLSTNYQSQNKQKYDTGEKQAYVGRVAMELINISMENKIRNSQNQQNISILNRLIKCENSSPL